MEAIYTEHMTVRQLRALLFEIEDQDAEIVVSIENSEVETVAPEWACPHCGENELDALIWTEGDTFKCTTCGKVVVLSLDLEA